MSIHVCKCIHSGREEYHLRYPGMTEAAAQELADEINGGALSYAKRYKEEQARRRAEVGADETAVQGDMLLPANAGGEPTAACGRSARP